MIDPTPNSWAAVIELIKMLGTLGSAAIAAYLVLHTKKQAAAVNEKLAVQELQNNRIEVLVNGNLHREQEETKRLRGILEANGIDHEAKP